MAKFRETQRARAQRLEEALRRMEEYYPDAGPELVYRNPFELLVAVMLSAQCTDKRVNAVTRELFEEYGTVQAMAA